MIYHAFYESSGGKYRVAWNKTTEAGHSLLSRKRHKSVLHILLEVKANERRHVSHVA